jgi:hypothetical protein
MNNKFEYHTIDYCSLEESLSKHGLVIYNHKSNDYICAYKHDDTYEIGFLNEAEIDDFLNGKSWVTKNQIKKFIKKHLQLEEITFKNLPIIYKIHSIINYFGVKNIMGPKLYEMNLTEAIRDFIYKTS